MAGLPDFRSRAVSEAPQATPMGDDQDFLDAVPAGELPDFRTRSTTPDLDPDASINSVLTQFGAGANQELANFIEAPTRAVAFLTNPLAEAAVGFIENTFNLAPAERTPEEQAFLERNKTGATRVGDAIRNAGGGGFGDFSTPVRAPQNTAERVARRAGQEVGATVPLAAMPLLAGASQGVRAGSPLVREGTEFASRSLANPGTRETIAAVGQQIARSAANSPAKTSLAELAATLGAGGGAGIAQEIEPGSATAEITGQLVGATAPTALSYTPTGIAVRGTRALITGGRSMGKRADKAATRAAEDRVRSITGGAIEGEDAQRTLSEAAEVTQRMGPDFNPTLAEQTGNQNLINQQARIEGRASGEELQEMIARREAAEQAVADFEARQAPGFDGEPIAVEDAISGRVEGLLDSVDDAAARLAADQEGIADAIPRVDDLAATGASIRERLTVLRDQTKQAMRDRAQELGLNDMDMRVPFDEFRDRVKSLFGKGSIFEDRRNLPDAAKDILVLGRNSDDLAKEAQELGIPVALLEERAAFMGASGSNSPDITFDDIIALRSRVSDDLRDARAGANPSSKEIANLVRLRAEIDGWVDDLAESSISIGPNERGAIKTFRDEYYNQFVKRFERGVVSRVRRSDGSGFYRTDDEKIAASFWKNDRQGGITAIRQLKAAAAGDPRLMRDIRNVAMDDLRDKTIRNGKIDQNRLRNWRNEHRKALEELPELDQMTRDLDSVTQAMDARAVQLTQRRATIENSILNRELRKIERGTQDTASIAARALKNEVLMGRVMNGLRGNPLAQTAWKRALWDQAVAQGDGIGPFLQKNQKALTQALGPTHYKDLEVIARARTMLNQTPPPTGTPSANDPLEKVNRSLGQGINQIGSRFFASASGRVGKNYVALDFLGRLVRGRSLLQEEKLLKEALYNPQVARDLATAYTSPDYKPEVARRLQVRLLNLGLESRRGDNEGEN